jgi:hypothetical protein
MNKKHLIIVFILLNACSGSINNKKEAIREKDQSRDYKSIIDDVIVRFSVGKTVPFEDLLRAVPTTQAEYLLYYSYTYPDKGDTINQAFNKIDSAISKNAANNQNGFFKSYLELAPFVDGAYAESYFDYIIFLIEKNKVEFCQTFKDLSIRSKKRLERYEGQYCK